MANILIVDDEAPMRRVLRRFLEAANHTVFEASDGVEGLAKLSELEIDLAFVDLGMPVMDGFELLRRMSQEHPGTKAVSMSTESSVLDFADREACIVRAIEKPFTREEVLAALAQALP